MKQSIPAPVVPLDDREWQEAEHDLALITAILLRLPFDRLIARASDTLDHLVVAGDEGSVSVARKIKQGLHTIVHTAKVLRAAQTSLRSIYDDAMKEAGDDRRSPDPNKL